MEVLIAHTVWSERFTLGCCSSVHSCIDYVCNGWKVRKWDMKSGRWKWKNSSPDQTSRIPASQQHEPVESCPTRRTEAGDSEQAGACTIFLWLLCHRSSEGRICWGYCSSAFCQSGCCSLWRLITCCSKERIPSSGENNGKAPAMAYVFENLAVFLGCAETLCSHLIIQPKQ